MKKLLCILLCLMLILPAALADTPAKKLTEDDPAYAWLYEKTLAMAAVFDEALRSDECIALATYDFPAFIQIDEEDLERIRMQDYTQPWDVTVVRADDLLAVYDPDGLRAKIEQMDPIPAYAATLARGEYLCEGISMWDQYGAGSDYLIATSLCFTDAFVVPKSLDGPCFAVAMYGGLYAFLVTFYPTENGVVFATALLIPSSAVDDLNLPLIV